jgi:hypothetical protein
VLAPLRLLLQGPGAVPLGTGLPEYNQEHRHVSTLAALDVPPCHVRGRPPVLQLPAELWSDRGADAGRPGDPRSIAQWQ